MSQQVARQVARLCSIQHLLEGSYIQEEGWNPNYIQSSIGRISRAHIVGVVVQQVHEQEFLLDDGTGRISVRAFNMDSDPPAVGAVVRIIGRPREYQSVRYLLPEAVREVSAVWAQLHTKMVEAQPKEDLVKPSVEDPVMVKEDAVSNEGMPEGGAEQHAPLKDQDAKQAPLGIESESPEDGAGQQNSAQEALVQGSQASRITSPTQGQTAQQNEPAENHQQTPKPAGQDPHTIIYTLIKNMDEGSGADHEEVIAKSNLANGEQVIESLMREGEIFLVAPGKLKVLE